jgi:hypothetical protein
MSSHNADEILLSHTLLGNSCNTPYCCSSKVLKVCGWGEGGAIHLMSRSPQQEKVCFDQTMAEEASQTALADQSAPGKRSV